MMDEREDLFDILDYPLAALVSSANEVRHAWGRKPVAIGQGVIMAGKTQNGLPEIFSPFPASDPAMKSLVYIENCDARYKEEATSGSKSSSEHLSIGVGISIGPPGLGSFLSVGVRGQYDRTINENSDYDKASIHSTFRMGMITFDKLPHLSMAAWESIPSRRGTPAQLARLTQKFGDYYCAGLIIGGDNSILMSASASNKSTKTKVNVQVTIKVLFWEVKLADITIETEDVEIDQDISIVGFDTLDNKFLNERMTYSPWRPFSFDQKLKMIRECQANARTLEKRIRAKMAGFGLVSGQSVSAETCQKILEAGLVAEILLCPISKHPTYVEARSKSL